MKIKIYLLVLFLIFMVFFSFSQERNTYYYYKDQKFQLNIDYRYVSIISESSNTSRSLPNNLFTIRSQTINLTRKNVVSLTGSTKQRLQQVSDPIYLEAELLKKQDSKNYFKLLSSLNKDKNIIKASPFYNISGKKMGLSNNFYVKLKKDTDIQNLYKLSNQYSVEVLGKNPFMDLWYTLSCGKSSPYNSIELANLFYESGLFETSEPEFILYDLQTTNDPLYSKQWALKNTGINDWTSGVDINVEKAWSLTKGSPNIKVAVFDHGIDMDHEDLKANIYGRGYDANNNSSPSILRGNHGTACAGIVAAVQDNGVGVSGVAPRVKLMSISINLLFSDTPQQLANGFNWAWRNGADVISNSWGGYAPSSIIDDAINSTLRNGRQGKGTVIVFAAGNENNTEIRYPGNSNPLILVVGAMSPCGERKNPFSCDGEWFWGSCYGTQLDVMAPGVSIPTTDITGNIGYTNGDYYENFNGTSSACPAVAGVVALMLSANPNLKVKEVNDIIERTARRVGNYAYTMGSDRPNGLWNQEMGYGLVDAYEAVRLARMYGFISLSTPEKQSLSILDINNENQNNDLLSKQNLIYPNPITDYLNIDLNTYFSGIIQILNINGELVYTQNSNSKESKIRIDVQNLPSGVYIMKILDTNHKIIKTQKIIKK